VRAWRVHEYGVAADVLTLDDIPEPEPGPGQLAVDVEAVGLNFPDLLLAAGLYQVKPPLPFTLGLEVCGRVVAAGPPAAGDTPAGWTAPSVGDRVLAFPALPAGGMADRSLVAAKDAFVVADDPPATDLAAMLLTYQTAWVGLHRRAALRAGETLLVHAGASGTGSAAIQVGKAIGARVVATAGGAEKVAACRDLGADEVVDYAPLEGPGALVEAMRAAVGKRGADVVWDPVGGDVFDASRRCVAFEGRLVVVGFASGRIPDAPANHLLVKNYSVVGLHWNLYQLYDRGVIDAAQEQIMRGYADGSLRPLVGSVRPLEEAPAALADLAGRRVLGKAVLTVAT
jgi:NADPH2:quinone reductase